MKAFLKQHLTPVQKFRLKRKACELKQLKLKAISRLDRQLLRLGVGTKLQSSLPQNYKVGMAVLIHERPEYLRFCLETLARTELAGIDFTILLIDDGSQDPEVRRLMEQPFPAQFKVHLIYTSKGHNSWGAAFNKAMQQLKRLNHFDIVGSCDADAVFHPQWLIKTLEICLWAKAHHPDHILGPFSSFNSSDFEFHGILGKYSSPAGNYVVKQRMGALNLFYLAQDLEKLGHFAESPDDETLMTRKLNRLRVRSFCTHTSYIDHIGNMSVLNEWRPVPVQSAVCGMNLVSPGWSLDLEKVSPRSLDYYKYGKDSHTMGDGVSSHLKLDVLITAIERDLVTLPKVVASIHRFLKHPVGQIYLISPASDKIQSLCQELGCVFVDEASILPFAKHSIDYQVQGWDRAGWMYQQFLKWSGDQICQSQHYLTLDADTILSAPQVFEREGKTLFLHSDEFHPPYFEMINRLLPDVKNCGVSFVSHQALFSVKWLNELKAELEKNSGLKWFEVILQKVDKREISGFSEYETYGQWVYTRYPELMEREYFYNQVILRKEFLKQVELPVQPGTRSISSHYYL